MQSTIQSTLTFHKRIANVTRSLHFSLSLVSAQLSLTGMRMRNGQGKDMELKHKWNITDCNAFNKRNLASTD